MPEKKAENTQTPYRCHRRSCRIGDAVIWAHEYRQSDQEHSNIQIPGHFVPFGASDSTAPGDYSPDKEQERQEAQFRQGIFVNGHTSPHLISLGMHVNLAILREVMNQEVGKGDADVDDPAEETLSGRSRPRFGLD